MIPGEPLLNTSPARVRWTPHSEAGRSRRGGRPPRRPGDAIYQAVELTLVAAVIGLLLASLVFGVIRAGAPTGELHMDQIEATR